ncbi:hypothetical protein NDR87_31540 [Nocardia sp. CDC159]|uniref:Transcriptional regulator n=1 Tax=Nocardia pulmonis TaxID=2951408 RepID=A0A9X2EGI9_9NOCA|nr:MULTISPECIES: hypothetical protein [Nocardia]MCM6777916.1 hypothetical protein [Nocardia pulmonis]MCM6790913.1 hypothetical protein [Nocardia sp. CDC159]
MIIGTWTGREVRILREVALREGREDFSARIGFGPKAIQKWELTASVDKPVKGRSAEALDTVLAQLKPAQRERFWSELSRARSLAAGHPVLSGTTAEPVLMIGPDHESGTDTWEVDYNVRRREFAKWAAAAAGAMLLSEDQAHIGMSDVQRVLAGVEMLEEQDQRVGGGGLVGLAVDQLDRATHLLETSTYDSTTGSAFTAAAGELAVLSGWLAFDADKHDLARRCYAQAMALGTEANNSDLIAHTCLYQANQSIALARSGKGSPYKALSLVGRARDLMRGRPPGRIHALIAVREAQAQGVLGDRSAFGRAIATAWREMDAAAQFEPIDQVPQWLRFVTHFEISGHEARGYGAIGDTDRAIGLFAAAVAEQASTRNITNMRAWSAATRAAAGDVSGAIEEGVAVLHALTEVASTRTLRVLAPIRAATEELTAGDAFNDQFDSLAAATAQKAITA